MITAKELSDAIHKMKMNMSDREINDLIEQVDYQGNQKINYSEFLSATLKLESFLDEQKLLAVFNQFDTDGSGKITEDNIYFAMQKLGMEVPRSEVRQIIVKHDLTKDGMIAFSEFKEMFQSEGMIKDTPFGADGP